MPLQWGAHPKERGEPTSRSFCATAPRSWQRGEAAGLTPFGRLPGLNSTRGLPLGFPEMRFCGVLRPICNRTRVTPSTPIPNFSLVCEYLYKTRRVVGSRLSWETAVVNIIIQRYFFFAVQHHACNFFTFFCTNTPPCPKYLQVYI